MIPKPRIPFIWSNLESNCHVTKNLTNWIPNNSLWRCKIQNLRENSSKTSFSVNFGAKILHFLSKMLKLWKIINEIFDENFSRWWDQEKNLSNMFVTTLTKCVALAFAITKFTKTQKKVPKKYVPKFKILEPRY